MISFHQLIKSKCRLLSSSRVLFLARIVAATTIIQLLINLLLYHHQTVICKNDPANLSTEPTTIYAITPTYYRYVQLAELTRLSHTFMLVPNLHWIIIEDSTNTTELVESFVTRLRNKFNFYNVTNLFTPTPATFKKKPNEPDWKYPKGVWQRNKALRWIRNNLDVLNPKGILYFADDDNTYDLELFEEMRSTKKVSTWPVGLAGNLLVEKPIVEEGKVKSFNAIWAKSRPFPLDMAGFAVNLAYYLEKGNATFSSDETIGYLESHFLGQLLNSWNELEPKANDCRKVLVWHTKTKNPSIRLERKLFTSYSDENL